MPIARDHPPVADKISSLPLIPVFDDPLGMTRRLLTGSPATSVF